MTFPARPTAQLVTDYDVDALVELLGLNDLELLPLTPEQVADKVRALVEDARSANPDVGVVLGEVAQTWVEGAADFNALLHERGGGPRLGGGTGRGGGDGRRVLARRGHLRQQPPERAWRGQDRRGRRRRTGRGGRR